MTKVIKLDVSYDGYYGGSVNETVLLPIEINGILFEELTEGIHHREVYLGEIEGKHSEVYGDLNGEFVDLDSLSQLDASSLVEESCFGEFEGFFESIGEFMYEEDGELSEGAKDIFAKYGVKEDSYQPIRDLHESFISHLKEKYVTSFEKITVLAEDLERAIEILNLNSIKTF